MLNLASHRVAAALIAASALAVTAPAAAQTSRERPLSAEVLDRMVPKHPGQLGALALFNDRVTKRAAAAHVALIDLRLACDEPEDYDRPTLLSKSSVQKVAKVVRFVMYELESGTRRTEVFF